MNWHGQLLYVADLEESVHFYGEILGLPVLARPEEHLAVIAMGGGVLYLHQDPEDAPEWLLEALSKRVRGIGVITHIEVEDMDALRERLAEHDVEVSAEPVEEHGHRQMYVYDPSGYNLVFVEIPVG